MGRRISVNFANCRSIFSEAVVVGIFGADGKK